MIEDIVTDRLLLRALTSDEARAVASGARRSNWAPDYPTDGDREIVNFLLTTSYAEPAVLGIRQMVDRDVGLVIGGIGFYGGPDADGQIAVGYGIAPGYARRGLTTEALAAMVDLARRSGEVTRIVADTTVDNLASKRVLEKAGFDLERTAGAQVFYRLALRPGLDL